MKLLSFSVLLGLGFLAAPAFAQEEEPDPRYVRICDAFGVGYYYIPGTNTCVRETDGQTREDTANGVVFGETTLARRIGALESDTAIATALEDPDLIAGERFGVRVNWGAAGSDNAAGISGTAVLADDLFGKRGRIAGSGAIGFTNGRVGGRAGLQLTW